MLRLTETDGSWQIRSLAAGVRRADKTPVEKRTSKDMKTLLSVSRRTPTQSEGVTLLSTKLSSTTRRSALRRGTSEVKEHKDIPVADNGANKQWKHVRLDRFFPDAKEVSIAGSFNGWNPGATAMEPFGTGCGQWEVDLHLEPGKYEYRFLVDGNWTDDPSGGPFVANPFGTRNSVFVVNAGDDTATNGATPRDDGSKNASKSSCSGLMENSAWLNSSNSTDVQRRKQIEALAYNLYLQRGKEPGHALEDWLEAEKRFDTVISNEKFADMDYVG